MSRKLYEQMVLCKEVYDKRKERMPALEGKLGSNDYVRYENEVDQLWMIYLNAKKKFYKSKGIKI